MEDELQLRIHGDDSLPTLIYLPGLHGDWTLIGGFLQALDGRVRFVEITYPRTLDWSLDDYAAAIEAALAQNGITSGWLLGESFGSQPLWVLVTRASSRAGVESALCADFSIRRLDTTTTLNGSSVTSPHPAPEHNFHIEGVILAGGFVKHPMRLTIWLAERLTGRMSNALFVWIIFSYAKISKFRHRNSPRILARIEEFVARRTDLDRRAAQHRLHLIAGFDPRPIARQAKLPIFGLSGILDPIVPWPLVRRWLKRNCPALRDYRIITSADHNVLATAPRQSASNVLEWMNGFAASACRRDCPTDLPH
jgi:pimeloyl-ACP methyl ester carboxylesterase